MYVSLGVRIEGACHFHGPAASSLYTLKTFLSQFLSFFGVANTPRALSGNLRRRNISKRIFSATQHIDWLECCLFAIIDRLPAPTFHRETNMSTAFSTILRLAVRRRPTESDSRSLAITKLSLQGVANHSTKYLTLVPEPFRVMIEWKIQGRLHSIHRRSAC